ncbi:bifunctional protein RfaE, domain I, partial [Vibrio parahaemolyticus V-223/04]
FMAVKIPTLVSSQKKH